MLILVKQYKAAKSILRLCSTYFTHFLFTVYWHTESTKQRICAVRLAHFWLCYRLRALHVLLYHLFCRTTDFVVNQIYNVFNVIELSVSNPSHFRREFCCQARPKTQH